MKNTLTILLILAVCSLTFGQDKFIYDQEGLNPKHVVVEMDSLEQNELFIKTINWIKESYKNPDEVIKTTIDNKKIRFEGFKDNLVCSSHSGGMVYCHSGLYTIEIEFKDNKYKFTPLSIEYKVPATSYTPARMFPISFIDGSAYYDKKGELRKMFETIPSSMETLFNDLNTNLSNYLLSEKKENEKDDW